MTETLTGILRLIVIVAGLAAVIALPVAIYLGISAEGVSLAERLMPAAVALGALVHLGIAAVLLEALDSLHRIERIAEDAARRRDR